MCQPEWKRGLGENGDTCIWMAESVCCSSETITTLLIGYTPIQNKKFKEKRRKPNSNKKSTLTTKSTDSSVLGSTKEVKSVLGA